MSFCCLRALNDFNQFKIINIFLEAFLITKEWLILSNRKKNCHILLISKYNDFNKLFENSRENSLIFTSEFSDKLKFRNKSEFIYKSQVLKNLKELLKFKDLEVEIWRMWHMMTYFSCIWVFGLIEGGLATHVLRKCKILFSQPQVTLYDEVLTM